MSRQANPLKIAVMEAIKTHLATVGSANWNLVIDQFPQVPSASMWRYIRQAKEDEIPKTTLVSAKAKVIQAVKGAVNDRVIEAKKNGTEAIAKHIPSAPSPAYVAKNGAQAVENIDFSREIASLYADAMMLRTFAVRLGEDGVEHIKNPMIFERQISRRTDLIEAGLKMMQEIWDLRTMQGFYETIIAEIGKESPDAQRRIMDRLRDLNGRTGMTMFAAVV